MKVLHYTVDIQNLLDIQNNSTIGIEEESKRKRKEFKKNKKELLKHLLPLVHGMVVLHNNKCTHVIYTTTGFIGLLGMSQINLEKTLDRLVESDYNFHDNGASYKGRLGSKTVSIWLNRFGKHQSTPQLPYSMTSFSDKQTYGNSVEDELRIIAGFCGRYTDEWVNK